VIHPEYPNTLPHDLIMRAFNLNDPSNTILISTDAYIGKKEEVYYVPYVLRNGR
jgi:hypothetical protein